jgi:hypothetical protein
MFEDGGLGVGHDAGQLEPRGYQASITKKSALAITSTLIYGISVNTEITIMWKGNPMNWIIVTYLAYLAVSVALTVWVARTLHRNGRVFLVDSFRGNELLADSVNHLLVVGFYRLCHPGPEVRCAGGEPAGGAGNPEHEGRPGAAGAGLHALLQPVRVLAHAPPRTGASCAAGDAAGSLKTMSPGGRSRPPASLL